MFAKTYLSYLQDEIDWITFCKYSEIIDRFLPEDKEYFLSEKGLYSFAEAANPSEELIAHRNRNSRNQMAVILFAVDNVGGSEAVNNGIEKRFNKAQGYVFGVAAEHSEMLFRITTVYEFIK